MQLVVRRTPVLAISFLVSVAASAPAQSLDFPSGVSSGDVTDRTAICWTQTATAESLRLQLATDDSFASPVQQIDVQTTAAADFAAKLDVTNLLPQTTYFFRFLRTRDATISPVGRFRTAPDADQPVPFRFVFTGDSNAKTQPFRILSFAAAELPDLWFWLGDTIYGDDPAGGLGVARTLDDYRAKYRQNLADPNLQALNAAAPVWVGWDDHEVANDYDGGDPEPDISRERINAGFQAFFEHLPIRPQNLPTDPNRAYRSFRYGSLAEFFILDARQYRSADAARVVGGGFSTLDPFAYIIPTHNDAFIRATRDASRTMLGLAQRDWLKQSVIASTARYKFIINPVPFTSLLVYPADRWDGYDAERYDILRALDLAGVSGVIVLATDSHANTVNPDITQYLRNKLHEPFSCGFSVPELIVGPIGTDTLGGEVRDLAALLFGGPSNPLGELFGTVVDAYALARVFLADGLTFADPDKFAYLVVDVADSGVTLTHRGIPPTNPPNATIQTLSTFHTTPEGRSPTPPCFLLPLLGLTAAFLAASRRKRTVSPPYEGGAGGGRFCRADDFPSRARKQAVPPVFPTRHPVLPSRHPAFPSRDREGAGTDHQQSPAPPLTISPSTVILPPWLSAHQPQRTQPAPQRNPPPSPWPAPPRSSTPASSTAATTSNSWPSSPTSAST